MTAKENMKTKLTKLRRQGEETGQVQLSASAVTLAAEASPLILKGLLRQNTVHGPELT